MKTKLFGFGGLLVLSLAACNSGSSTTTTDSTTVAADTSQTTATDASASNNIPVHFDASASYVDLKTGKPVKLRVDTVTHYIVEEVTNQPVMYFINPATNDTFDRSGRIVNRALIRSSNGDYTIDESRITVSSDDNSSTSATDADDTADTANTTADETTTATGNSKTKIKEDKFKQKTDNSKVKVKEDKVKVKTSSE
jgi:hypothetical protein